MKSIRSRRHILIMAILLFAGFAVTSLVNFYVSRASLRREIAENELPITGDTIYSEIQRDLLRPIFISSTMANDTFLRDWALDGERNTDKITRYLKEIQMKYDTVTSFFVSDNSSVYYHADGVLKRINPDEERDVWFYRVRDMKDPYEVNVDVDMANDDAMTIFINYRVLDYRGNFIGATGVGLMVDSVKRRIYDYQERYGRNIYFTDRQGRITLACRGLKGDSDIHEREGISPLADEILSADLSGKTGYHRYRRNGGIIHLDTRFIPEFQWFLFVEQGEAKATEVIRHALVINLLVGFATSVFVIVLACLTIGSYERRLEVAATTDALTGIDNRFASEAALEDVMQDISRRWGGCSVLLVDIDHFKNVNDSYDHLVGDAVIRHVTSTIRDNIREGDVFGRWGGDEFMIILKDIGLDGALLQADRLRKAVKRSSCPHEDGEIDVTISIGVTAFQPGETEDELLSRVDRALYAAKEAGRDRVEAL